MTDFSLFSENPLLLYVLIAIISLIVGSFLNVVIYRLPLVLREQYNPGNSTASSLSLVHPRSHCPHCGQTLRVIDNIPIISYLLLRGKCAFCKAKIHYHYPLVEMLSLVLSLAVVGHWGFNFTAVAGLIFTWTLIGLTVIDLQKMILPDEMTLGLLWTGMLLSLNKTFSDPASAIIGVISGYGFFWMLNHVFSLVAKKHGLGNGDMKLLASFGAWFGWQALPAIVILASASGLLVAVPLLLAGKINRGQPIPFGPYLCLAAWIVMMSPNLLELIYG